MIIQLFQFIFYIARSDQMQQKIDLLFENKIGCVGNLFGFNEGEKEILKTAAWISLNEMMIAQQKDYNDQEFHIAQWILVIKIGKNVASFLNANKSDASSIWQDLEKIANGQERGNETMHLIDYMVERCR